MKDISSTGYSVHGWMRTELNLKGIELELYAIIYGFSQDGVSTFYGGIKYLMEWTGASKPTVIKALTSLVERGIVSKEDIELADHIKTVRYSAILPAVKFFNQGGKETLPGAVKFFNQGGKEILPNIKNDIKPIIYNNINNKLSSSKDDDCSASTTAINEVISAWNQLECLGVAPVKSMSATSKRYGMLKSRISEYKLDSVLSAIDNIKNSPFLLGKAGKEPFFITFDWFVKPNNFIKVFEGNYLDRNAEPQKEQLPVDEWGWQ